MDHEAGGLDLLWIPLGADGSGFVRLNGRLYEAIAARRQRRRPLDLYHTALTVDLPERRFVVETTWPSPDADTRARGVVVEAPVFSHRLRRMRMFRYEVRCWPDGVVLDARQAVGGPRRVSDDPAVSRRLLGLASSVPPLVWGRDELRTGDMWNSNSVISWLLTRCGLRMQEIVPPDGGRAPGWDAGVAAALRG